MNYPFPFLAAGLAAFLAAGFFAAASFFGAGAAAIDSTSGTTTGFFSGSSERTNRATASFESSNRSCFRTSYGCNALGADSFTPSRLRLANSRLRFSPCETSNADLVKFSFSSVETSDWVLCDSSCQASTTVSFWSASFAQRAEQLLFRQRIAVIARAGPVNRTAMTPQRRPDRTDTRTARALLPPQLAAGSGHFALFLHLVRTAAQARQIPPRSFMQQVRIHLGAEYGVRQLDFADFLSVQIDYIHDWHNLVSFVIRSGFVRTNPEILQF